jgi:hypothetical protein
MDLLINKIIQAASDTALLLSLPATSEMFLQRVQKHAKQDKEVHDHEKNLYPLCRRSHAILMCSRHIGEYRETARKGISFSQILKDPDTYMNSVFIFGGIIVQTTHTKGGSEIEVIENPLDRYGDISDKDISEGRLILVTSRRLDPLIYKDGRTITFAGTHRHEGKNVCRNPISLSCFRGKGTASLETGNALLHALSVVV